LFSWGFGAIEEAIDFIKEDLKYEEFSSDYSQEDLNLLNDFFDVMVSSEKEGNVVFYIGE